ncbi:MAG: hypothetical protein ACYTEL_08330 [Planctomycetota bacterium]
MARNRRKAGKVDKAKKTREALVLAGLILIVGAIVFAVHWPALEAKVPSFDDANLYYNFGVALTKQGLAEQAVNEFVQTLRINPNHPHARAALQATSREPERSRNR